MVSPRIDRGVLVDALDAWEADRASYDLSVWETFNLVCPTEARYLWLLTRGHRPPEKLVGEALCNLLEWGLITDRGAVTLFGRRLLAAHEHPRAMSGRAR